MNDVWNFFYFLVVFGFKEKKSNIRDLEKVFSGKYGSKDSRFRCFFLFFLLGCRIVL